MDDYDYDGVPSPPVRAEGPWARVYGGRTQNAHQMPQFIAASDAWAESAVKCDEVVAWGKAADANHRIESTHWHEAADALAKAGAATGQDGASLMVHEAALVEARAEVRMALRANRMAGNAREKMDARAKAARVAREVATEYERADGGWRGVVKESESAKASLARADEAWEAAKQAEARARSLKPADEALMASWSSYDSTAFRNAAEGASAWAEQAGSISDMYAAYAAEAAEVRRNLVAAGDRTNQDLNPHAG